MTEQAWDPGPVYYEPPARASRVPQAPDRAPAAGQLPITLDGVARSVPAGSTILEVCRDNGIVIQAWSPLTRAQRLNDDKLTHMAARYGKTPAQLIIRWNLQSGVVPLPKAADPRHQAELLNVIDFEITGTDMSRLNALNEYYSALGKLLYV